jgi:DNA polymerase III subunit gamma/tau
VAERPSPASDPLDAVPDDADAPPEDEEPPFDPGAPPEIDLEPVAPEAAPVRRAPRSNAARGASVPAPADGIQRYGEAVVREVLGATFLEEVEAPARPGFGERG